MVQNSKIWGVRKKFELFDIWKILKILHLMAHQMANRWHIQKSETGHLEHPRIHLLTDSWWNKSMSEVL